MRYFIVIFILLISSGFCISYSDIEEYVSTSYLISPESENSLSSNFYKINCEEEYYVLPLAQREFIFINASNFNEVIPKDKADDLIKTIYFYNSLPDLKPSSSSKNYFVQMIRVVEDYNYNIELAKVEVKKLEEYSEIYSQLKGMQEDLGEINKNFESMLNYTKDIIDLLDDEKKCDNYLQLIQVGQEFRDKIDETQDLILDYDKDSRWILDNILKSDMDPSLRSYISDMGQVPDPLIQFLDERGSYDLLVDTILSSENSIDDTQLELVYQNYAKRLDRQDIYEVYYSPLDNEDFDTLKEYFEYIAKNEQRWERRGAYNRFKIDYDSFISFFEQENYSKSYEMLLGLESLAKSVEESGFKEVQNTQRTQEESFKFDYMWIVYGVIALILIVMIPKGIHKIEDIIEESREKEDGDEPDINIKF